MKNIKFGHVLKSKKLTALVASVVFVTVFSFTKVHAATTQIRFNGADRYETAAKACEDGWTQDTDYAVIVNGENYPDAISAAPLAKKYDAPILLTGSDTLNAYTSVEINRLNVKNVFIIGGKSVISQSIEDSLKARGIKVTRIGGADRYETGVLVAQRLGKPSEIAVVNGDDFHDGLSIAPIAALKGIPIILTSRDSLPSVSQKYLQANNNVDETYVVGDSDQVSDSVFSLIPKGERIGSGDAYSRNAGVIDAFKSEINTGTIYIASAKDFPDALVASAVAPRTASPVFYVDDPISQATMDCLKSKIVNNIKIVGGLGAVSTNTQTSIEGIPLGVASANNLTDVIWQNDAYTLRPTIVATATDGSTQEVPVTWDVTKVNTSQAGTYTITGKLDGTDKTVTTTLIVKPTPVKIADITATSNNSSDYSMPSTVSAQMSDGTTVNLPVTWDLGTQQANKPGTTVFNGTIDHYSKKVKLTLTSTSTSNTATVNPSQISTIPMVKLRLTTLGGFSSSPYYISVPATLNNGSSQNVNVTWYANNIVPYPGYAGVYECYGTVTGYSGTVTALIMVGNASDPTTTSANLTYLPSINVMQGSPYNLPTTATDPTTGKQVPVTWQSTNIDPTLISTGYIETSRVSAITFVGTESNATTSQFGIVVNVRPGIAGIDPSCLNQTISRASYSGTTFQLPNTLTAILPDGSKSTISVLSWNVPTVSLGANETYTIQGTVDMYSQPVTFNLTITN